VGFLPRIYLRQANDYDGAILQITRDLRTSPNSAERQKSHRNKGMVVAAVIRN
jgi:hypothetical protein